MKLLKPLFGKNTQPSFLKAISGLCVVLLIAPGAAIADTSDAPARTSAHVIQSEVLGEEREIFLRLPPSYDGERALPVVYVLDAEGTFEFVAAYVDYMVDAGVYPPMAMAGAVNVNRNRDYVPAADEHFLDTGSADAFLEFVRAEWMPFVEGEIRTTGDKILVGHSFGGVFALHTLFTEPDTFDAYIALGTSAWIADRVLFDEAEAFFDAHQDNRSYVYMAVGEYDGGPTRPSSEDLAKLFEKSAPAGMEWTFDITPGAEHFRNFTTGLNDAMMDLFPMASLLEEARIAGEAGRAAVMAWAAEKRAALGYRFFPAWFDFGVLAMQLSNEGHLEGAKALGEVLVGYHPHDPILASFNARVLRDGGELKAAIAEYDRAIALATERGLHPNSVRLERLEAARAQTQELLAAAE